jgi:hypothetical protein
VHTSSITVNVTALHCEFGVDPVTYNHPPHLSMRVVVFPDWLHTSVFGVAILSLTQVAKAPGFPVAERCATCRAVPNQIPPYMPVSAATLDVGSDAITSAPLASKVKREAEGSLAVTKLEPGFQPIMPVLATAASLVLPKLRPAPATAIRNVDVDGQLVGPEEVLDGMSVLIELVDNDGVGMVDEEESTSGAEGVGETEGEDDTATGVEETKSEKDVTGFMLSEEEGVGVALSDGELDGVGASLVKDGLNDVGVSLVEDVLEDIGDSLVEDEDDLEGVGVGHAEGEKVELGVVDTVAAIDDMPLLTAHAGPVEGKAQPTS